MKDGIYRHVNWDGLVVEIKNNELVQLVSEPPTNNTLWHQAVRGAWIDMIRDRRQISENEDDYFIEEQEE